MAGVKPPLEATGDVPLTLETYDKAGMSADTKARKIGTPATPLGAAKT